jgi:hypothetical protein
MPWIRAGLHVVVSVGTPFTDATPGGPPVNTLCARSACVNAAAFSRSKERLGSHRRFCPMAAAGESGVTLILLATS